MTTVSRVDFWIGDLVTILPQHEGKYPGVVYEVVRVNSKTVSLRALGAAAGWGRATPSLLVKVDGARAEQARRQQAEQRAAVPPMRPGTVVRFVDASRAGHQGLWVVVADKGDTVRLHVLAGPPRAKYWPSAPKAALAVVEHGTF